MATAKNALPFPGTKQVTIYYDKEKNELRVDPPACYVDPKNKESIEWAADFPFYICFERDSPFTKGNHFSHVDNQSGTTTDWSSGRYKYCVEAMGKTLDPDVIVQR
jgi:hypothetical protein